MNNISKETVSKLLLEHSIELMSTHSKLCYPIINRIYKKMAIGIKFPSIKVDGNLIIDGHHRYVAALLAGKKLNVVSSQKTSATIIYQWESIVLDIEDWDTDAKIRMLNEEDAKYNAIDIDKLIDLIK